MDKKRKRKNTALPLLLAALTLAGAGLWWGNYTLSTEEYTFTSRRLPQGWDGARIVVLSDLHGRRFGRDNSRLLEAVRKARPDIIALVGDLVDEWSGTEYLRPLLRGLTAMAPTYFVSGNHEWAAGAMSELTPLLKECGVTYLSNTFVTLERNGGAIAVAGIDDPNGFADQKTPQEVARDVRDAIGGPDQRDKEKRRAGHLRGHHLLPHHRELGCRGWDHDGQRRVDGYFYLSRLPIQGHGCADHQFPPAGIHPDHAGVRPGGPGAYPGGIP